MDAKKISRIRRAVKKAKQSSRLRVRYPKQIKAEVVELLQSGVAPTELAKLTGLALSTLFKWSRISLASETKSFRRLKVATAVQTAPRPAATAQLNFMIRLPNGITIECRSGDALKEVLGALK